MSKKTRNTEVETNGGTLDANDVKEKAVEEKKKAKDKYEGISEQGLVNIIRDRDAIAANLHMSVNTLSQRVDEKEERIQELLEDIVKHKSQLTLAVNAKSDAEKRAIEALNEQNNLRRSVKELEELLTGKRAKIEKLKEQKRELFEYKKESSKEIANLEKKLTTAVAIIQDLVNKGKEVQECEKELEELKQELNLDPEKVVEEMERLQEMPSLLEGVDEQEASDVQP